MERIDDIFVRNSRKISGKVAVANATGKINYDLLLKKASECGTLIENLKFKFVAVGILLPNSVEFVVSVMSVWISKNVVVPLNIGYNDYDLLRIIKILKINILITNLSRASQLRKSFNGLIFEIKPDLSLKFCLQDFIKEEISVFSGEHAVGFLTSGTTGSPKIVGLTHQNLLCNIKSERKCISLPENHMTYVHLPMCHSYIFTLQMLSHLLSSGSIYIGAGHKSSVELVREIDNSSCNSIFAVPSLFHVILDGMNRTKKKLTSLNYLVNGASSMTEPLLNRISKAFTSAKIYLTYGLTEASPLVTCLPPSLIESKGCSIGLPVEGVDVRLLNGEIHETNEKVGEIIVKGESVITEYIGNPEVNKDSFVRNYLRTGDLARMDKSGCLFLNGRIKDIINRGGENIYPSEVEEVLLKDKNIVEAAVVPHPHPILGEVPFAFVTIRNNSKRNVSSSMMKLCSEFLPLNKRPVGIKVINEFPRTLTGKILKSELICLLKEESD